LSLGCHGGWALDGWELPAARPERAWDTGVAMGGSLSIFFFC
jgi:hypothetical protein